MTSENASTSATWNFPIPKAQLTSIAHEACDKVLSEVTAYDHEKCALWTSSIINYCIEALQKGTAPPSDSEEKDSKSGSKKLKYRFIVSCTIIEQSKDVATYGRRGMRHCAGAYWDAERDGMWSYKYSSDEDKGLEVPMTIAWFATPI